MLREQPVIGRPAKESNNALVVLVDKRCDWAIPDDIDAPSDKRVAGSLKISQRRRKAKFSGKPGF